MYEQGIEKRIPLFRFSIKRKSRYEFSDSFAPVIWLLIRTLDLYLVHTIYTWDTWKTLKDEHANTKISIIESKNPYRKLYVITKMIIYKKNAKQMFPI